MIYKVLAISFFASSMVFASLGLISRGLILWDPCPAGSVAVLGATQMVACAVDARSAAK